MSKELYVVKASCKLGLRPEEVGMAAAFDTAGMTEEGIKYRARGLAIVALLGVHPGCESRVCDENINAEIVHTESNELVPGVHTVVFSARSICQRSFGRKAEIDHGQHVVTIDHGVDTAEDLYKVATAACAQEAEAAYPGKPSTLIIDNYQHYIGRPTELAIAS